MNLQINEQSMPLLSDKDYMLVSKTFRRVAELYYQNSDSQLYLQNLICLTSMVPSIVPSKYTNGLTIASQMQILKAKTKGNAILKQKLEKALEHLRQPKFVAINTGHLIDAISKVELYIFSCTVILRYLPLLKNNHELDWKVIIDSMSLNIAKSPHLSVQLLNQVCKGNDQNNRLLSKSGIIKYMFVDYFQSNLKDKFNLYKGIKLIKSASLVDKTQVRQRQKTLALIIYTYQNYIPAVSEICSKCYDQDYSNSIIKKNIYEVGGVDYTYLWSYVEQFSKNHINQQIINNYKALLLKKTYGQLQSKIYAICSNFCKFSKFISKQLLKAIPFYQDSLLNYLKMCFNMSQIDIVTPHFMNWSQLDNLLVVNSNPKAQQLAHYLKDLMSAKVRVGSLSQKFIKIFAIDKNADLLLDRASKIPSNNQQLGNIRTILSQKGNNNEFDSDTLKMAKDRALKSLRQAISRKTKLDVNSILTNMQINDIHQTSQLLQTLELYLTMFQDQAQNINVDKILELIKWIQENYNGQIIDWGSIAQILSLICDQDQWKRHLKQFNKHTFWILSIGDLTQDDQKLIWQTFLSMKQQEFNKKLPFAYGFLGKVYTNILRANCLDKRRQKLQKIVSNIAKNQDYNLNIMMLSYFIRGWGFQQQDYDPQNFTQKFSQLIEPIASIVTSHPRQTPQQLYFLQSCLPFKFNTTKISTQLDSLVRNNGRLAGKVYEQLIKNGKKNIPVKIDSLQGQQAEKIHNVMAFAQQFPSTIKGNSIIKLVDHLEAQPNSYWQLYPRYVDIMSNVINVVGRSENQQIKQSLSHITGSLIKQIIGNQEIVDQQRHQLLTEIKDSFENIRERGVYIEIERIKKIVTKIVETEKRQEILFILNNYKIKEEQKHEQQLIQQQIERKVPSVVKQWIHQEKKPLLNVVPQSATFSNKDQFTPNNFVSSKTTGTSKQKNDIQNKKLQSLPLQKMFQSVKVNKNMILIDAFEILKKIVAKELPPQKFKQVYTVFQQNNLNQNQRQLLGGLLTNFYNILNCQKALSLMLRTDKTDISRDQIFQLVSKFIPTFALNKRQKLVSRAYLDIAMQRVKQGFLSDGCEVASYNINQSDDLEYFYSKKYHKMVIDLIQTAKSEDQIAQLLILIGKAAKFPQIRSEWIESLVHTKIMKFIHLFPKSIKVISNLNFALSALTFEQKKACGQCIRQSKQMNLILQGILSQPTNKLVIQYASLFIYNLSFSRCFQSCPEFDVKKIIEVLKVLFSANLQTDNIDPYKYILKAIGQLSNHERYCSDILEPKFCEDIIKFSQKVDILIGFDQNKGKCIQMLIDLISNLSKNKQKIMVLHNSKITLLAITLLEIIDTTHPELIASCIDAINALSENATIEAWFVKQKRLPFIILDILKLQSEQKLLLKSMRMVANLTINNTCIPFLLKSNILGIIANVVIPHLGIHQVSSQNKQFSKRIQAYIFKIITRVFEVKPPIDLILKSGYLQCLVKIIEMIEVESNCLDILFYYSPHVPNFLSKRAFSSLIKILTVKVTDKQALAKCLQSLRNILSFTYEAQQQNQLIEGISDMYLKFLQTQYTEDALFLLAYHLLRSQKFRELLRQPQDRIQAILQVLGQQQKQRYKQLCRSILFLIYSPPANIWLGESIEPVQGKQYEIMRKGIRCMLFRSDGSHKQAIIDIDQEYNFRVYKHPNGQIKKKYTANVRHIREFQFQYQKYSELWFKSLFNLQKTFFHNSQPQNCCTLISNQAWGSINLINIQFYNPEDKILFYMCLSHLLAIFRL